MWGHQNELNTPELPRCTSLLGEAHQGKKVRLEERKLVAATIRQLECDRDRLAADDCEAAHDTTNAEVHVHVHVTLLLGAQAEQPEGCHCGEGGVDGKGWLRCQLRHLHMRCILQKRSFQSVACTGQLRSMSVLA